MGGLFAEGHKTSTRPDRKWFEVPYGKWAVTRRAAARKLLHRLDIGAAERYAELPQAKRRIPTSPPPAAAHHAREQALRHDRRRAVRRASQSKKQISRANEPMQFAMGPS